ncbi:hypothetical protein RCH14_000624 [Massilia sp. MP_M2]|uniref:aminotransferase class III-fold pyridoxal phosphate-dependent enzyme n=1 Tax=Massilia sp. MP_M2 TaxID=3071713 RepID=UPI00319EA1A3
MPCGHGQPEIAAAIAHTYSGHPLACAAALATLDVFAEQGVLANGAAIQPYFDEALQSQQSLRGLPHVIDLRSIGIIAGIKLATIPRQPGARGYAALKVAFACGSVDPHDGRHHHPVAAAGVGAAACGCIVRQARCGAETAGLMTRARVSLRWCEGARPQR